MLNLLNDAFIAVPIIVVLFVIAIAAAAIFVAARKQQSITKASTEAKLETQHKTVKKTPSRDKNCDVHTHMGNRAVARDGHVHIGDDEEHYDKIVGSLGEVDDEGCADLDGIRLIARDIAYDGDEEKHDYSEIVKAMVIGEVIATPKCRKK